MTFIDSATNEWKVKKLIAVWSANAFGIAAKFTLWLTREFSRINWFYLRNRFANFITWLNRKLAQFSALKLLLKLELLKIILVCKTVSRSLIHNFRDNRKQFRVNFNKRQAINDLENETSKLTLEISPIEAVDWVIFPRSAIWAGSWVSHDGWGFDGNWSICWIVMINSG